MNVNRIQRTNDAAVQRLSTLLALLLFLGPLLAIAAPATSAPPTLEGVAQSSPQRPCHSMAGAGQNPLEAVAIDTQCPHCSGDAPASQCHCWGNLLPAGLAATSVGRPAVTAAPGGPLRIAADALPDSPPENLFRPPILTHA
jgi:hypothetical protein